MPDAAPCPYCQMPTTAGSVTTCPSCRTSHHVECWAENTGCAVALCAEGPKVPYIPNNETSAVQRRRITVQDDDVPAPVSRRIAVDAAGIPRRHAALAQPVARLLPVPASGRRSSAAAIVLVAAVLLAAIGLAIAAGVGR